MQTTFIASAEGSQILALIQDEYGLSRYLATPVMQGDRTATAMFINGRGYFVDTVGAAFANSFERTGMHKGMHDIKPAMLSAIMLTHAKRWSR